MNEMSGAAISWRSALQEVLNSEITSEQPVRGGDIGTSYRVCLASGLTVFVKHYPGSPPGVAKAEVDGLRWLADDRPASAPADHSLRIAVPHASGSDWLALEWIESASPGPDYPLSLGRGLAELHGRSDATFGARADNWLAGLPQDNTPTNEWSEFYGERRLRPLIRRACDHSLLSAEVVRSLDQVIEELPERVGQSEIPARLHGDLWSGNVLPDERGLPCLIDPAAYAGHREIDLAMMRLFGGFPESVFHAYHEVYPLSAGWRERVPLYQLYPLLAHVNLFGASYASQLEAAIRSLRSD